jgi:large subunit ribosomal protein L5
MSKDAGEAMSVRLREKYDKEIIPALKSQFNYSNPHQVPKLEKIIINAGVGEAIQNAKALELAVNDVTKIAGQKPIIRKARKSIANFKLREGMPIGTKVTLRRTRMYEFLDRLLNVALPRVRDFRGIPKNSFDGKGNYSLGIKEQIIFPEIDLDKTQLRGLSITFVTSATTDDEGRALLKEFGFPFRK